ncbi:MAG: hypothetical protein AB3X41_00925 [Leptothrix ochracea]|uniref:hypothetical protein n=1 Tax=Leptothrix ochracea TaxID=735331 RepID=UPI0034E198E2
MELIETIGALAFVYALLSVLASSLKEVIEARLQQRKAGLKSAVEDLLTVQGAAALVGHASIDVINQASAVTDPSTHTNWPSYLDPNTFAKAVYALELSDQIPPNSRLAQALNGLKIPGTESERVQAIVGLYSERMDRLQGTFKRQAQRWLLGIGLVLAAALNADTVELARDLSQNPARRAMMMAMAQNQASFESLRTSCQRSATKLGEEASTAAHLGDTRALMDCLTPELSRSGLGWTQDRWHALVGSGFSMALIGALLLKLLGYGLTALAVSLGAPFWFDLLGKVSNLRATLKPATNPAAS